jgi:hypothetical protein
MARRFNRQRPVVVIDVANPRRVVTRQSGSPFDGTSDFGQEAAQRIQFAVNNTDTSIAAVHWAAVPSAIFGPRSFVVKRH